MYMYSLFMVQYSARTGHWWRYLQEVLGLCTLTLVAIFIYYSCRLYSEGKSYILYVSSAGAGKLNQSTSLFAITLWCSNCICTEDALRCSLCVLNTTIYGFHRNDTHPATSWLQNVQDVVNCPVESIRL